MPVIINNGDTRLEEFHRRVIRETFPNEITDNEAFLLFSLLHMYCIGLSQNVMLTDAPQVEYISPLTQRGASDVVAEIWRDNDDERSDDNYWYWKWNTDWEGYTHFKHLSRDEQQRLDTLKVTLEQHPFVKYIVLEDEMLA